MLLFAQNITRTKLLAMEPPEHNHPLVSNYLNQVLTEQLFTQSYPPLNTQDLSPEAARSRAQRRCQLIASYMEVVYRALATSQTGSHLASDRVQIDERATVETFCKRLVSREIYEHFEDVCEDVYDDVNETIIDKEGCVRYRIRAELAWQLRSSDPLKPFVAKGDPSCSEGALPECNYRPEAFGLQPVDCFRFSCIPHARTRASEEFARSVAGYWSRNPFFEGDPCEFGLVGAVDAKRSEKVHRELSRTSLSPDMKTNVWTRHAMGEGILTAFAWTSAQAYNQGFTVYNELTYPFASQLLLIDDNYVQLLRYQLNSLTSLWKADDAGLPYNMAWITPRIRLYEVEGEDSGKLWINPEAVSLIVSAMLHPTERDSEENLRPFLSDGPAPRDRIQYSPTQDPATFLIPNVKDCPDYEVEVGTTHLNTDIPMSTSERAAFEASQQTKKKVPLRLSTPTRPHPNDVFFFKMTKKSDLVNEIRRLVPSFGGQFGALPEPYRSALRRWQIQKRNRQARLRVQAPPRRWR
ncbi:unnamed protein product [Calicophoron daubneyi]|uniref:Uncharacterized protein n=1 Tax=Calicophoron daubneyi TaxID=300641 RepID=A0AAV2THS8_CALDB